MNRRRRCCRGHGRSGPGQVRYMEPRPQPPSSSPSGTNTSCTGSPSTSSNYHFLIVLILIGASYSLVAYHCHQCSRAPDMHLRRNINDLTVLLNTMQKNYEELEQKILYVSTELPLIKAQVQSLENLANLVKSGNESGCKRELIPLPKYLIKADKFPDDHNFNEDIRMLCPACWHYE